MNYAIEQRLRLIDFLLAHYGYVGRNELCAFYGVSQPQATRDFKLYKSLRPENCVYDVSSRRYIKTPVFEALFNHEAGAE